MSPAAIRTRESSYEAFQKVLIGVTALCPWPWIWSNDTAVDYGSFAHPWGPERVCIRLETVRLEEKRVQGGPGGGAPKVR